MNLDKEFMLSIRPLTGMQMLRLGSKFDGGYVLPERTIKDCEMLLSFGYGYNAKFEFALLNSRKEILCYLYDSEINLISTVKHLLLNILFLRGLKSHPVYSVKATIRYIQVLLAKRIKYRNYMVVADPKARREISFESVVGKAKGKRAILKMDIEGSEYECLSATAFLNSRLACIIVEFHEIATRKSEFLLTLEKLKSEYYLVNTHINNFGLIKDGIPDVIELTFVDKTLMPTSGLIPALEIPGPLNSPCDASKLEVTYGYQ